TKLEALSSLGQYRVAVYAGPAPGTYFVELKGDLVFTNDARLVAVGATAVIDGTALKLNQPWSVPPAHGATFEISRFAAVELPNVRARLYPRAVPAVVVAESGGGTSVSEGAGASGNDSIQVRLSAAPAGGRPPEPSTPPTRPPRPPAAPRASAR